MSILLDEVTNRILQVNEEIEFLEKRKNPDTEGHIRVSKDDGRYRYYYVTSDNVSPGKYLKRSERKLAETIIQKDYEDSVLKSLYSERDALLALQAVYSFEYEHFYYGPEERIWQNLSEGRRQLAVPVIPDDETFVKGWMSEKYERKPFSEDAPEYYTGTGIRVRSKTELIIAEMLEKKGIPFYYEKPLILKGFGKIHPDFTVLNIRKRKTMYLEHMGMMDDPEYLNHALERINRYETAGYFPGIDLILTFESSARPVKTRLIEKMIDVYLT